jgi:hypothetical protein
MHTQDIMAMVLVFLVILCGISGSTAAREESLRVVYDRNGEALLLCGGDKDRLLPEYTLRSSAKVSHPTLLRYYDSANLSDTDQESFGDGSVFTSFDSTAEYYDALWGDEDWIEVEGETSTAWLGTEPQWNSDEIELRESWTLEFQWLDYLQYPFSADWSDSSDTIEYEHTDTSGDWWAMMHDYSGLFGMGRNPTRVSQSSSGTHKFTTGGIHLITTTAHDYENI